MHTRDPYVVHRDIKGANVLVGEDCRPKLADFGCSKRTDQTLTHTMRGSIPWMAPEVIAHSRYGRAADIWSFGCLVIEMATAETPWGSFDNLMAAMIKIGMSMEMPAMPEELSPSCRGFIKRCLQREPRKRLSATELLHEDFVRGQNGDVEKPLPEGWEKHFDPCHNEWFYWHGASNTSSWERPNEDEEDEDEEEDEAEGTSEPKSQLETLR